MSKARAPPPPPRCWQGRWTPRAAHAWSRWSRGGTSIRRGCSRSSSRKRVGSNPGRREPGRAQPGPRQDEPLLGLMPGYLGSPETLGLKVVTVMPGNHGTVYDSHQGAVLIFEAKNGCLLAVVDASSITAIRTAAVSGAATRALAREDAADLAI